LWSDWQYRIASLNDHLCNHFITCFSVFNLLKQNGGDKGNGYGGYTFKFNNHSLTALDTTDDSCDTIKNTTSNQNVLADLANYRLVVKKNSPTTLLPPS
jgi:hypothetical protein